MKKIYIFGGLGADETVFQKLEFCDYQPVFVNWKMPLETEDLSQHAMRLSAEITDTKPLLLGISFGGILAIEISKIVPCRNVIIISSLKTRSELPPYFRFASSLSLHKLLPAKLLLIPNAITNWFFGAKTNEEKSILKEVLKKTDPRYLRWAINEIVNWQNTNTLSNILHLHGSSDRILPSRYVHPDYSIKHGGHLMTIGKSKEINQILQNILKNE